MKSSKKPDPIAPAPPPVKESSAEVSDSNRKQLLEEKKKKGIRSTLLSDAQPQTGKKLG